MNAVVKLYRNRAGPLGAWVALSLMGLIAAPAAAQRRVVLPEGSVIPVKLDQSISSKTARVGNTFSATVRYGDDDGGLPQGARVEGVISEVIRASAGQPGVLDMNFRRLVTTGGQSRTLTGSLVSLDAKSVKRSETGRLVASADKGKDRLKWVGIGAGAGLLAGVLTKGNKLVDILLGAGAGYAYNEFGNNAKAGDVNLKQGAEFGILLDRQFAFNTNRTDQYASDERSTLSDENYGVRDRRGVDYQNGDRRNGYRSEEIGMTIDDRDVAFGDAKPFMRNGVSYVPLGPVARAANFQYGYNSQQRIVNARDGALRMGLGSRNAMYNGTSHQFSAAPEIRYGQLYVPVQFVEIAAGGTSTWDAGNRNVVFVSNGDGYVDRNVSTTYDDRYTPTSSRYGTSQIGVTIDGREVSFGDAKPFIRSGVSFVPMDPVARAARLNCTYNSQTRVISGRNGALRARMGSRYATFNGSARRLPAAPEMRYGQVYVPVHFFGLLTGSEAEWDTGTRTIILNTRGSN